MSHFSQNESLALRLHSFHKMQNTVLITSQETQGRIIEESILRQISLFPLSFPSLSYSALWSLVLFICLSLSLSLSRPPCLTHFSSSLSLCVLHSLSLSRSPSPSFCLLFRYIVSLSPWLIFSHTPTHPLDPTHFSCLSVFISVSLSFSSPLSHTRFGVSSGLFWLGWW